MACRLFEELMGGAHAFVHDCLITPVGLFTHVCSICQYYLTVTHADLSLEQVVGVKRGQLTDEPTLAKAKS